MNFPNAINSPTAADLARKTIIDLGVYVYETALAYSGNVEYAEGVLRDFVTRAEAAATRADADASIISAKFDEAIAAADEADDAATRAADAANQSEQYAEQIAPYAMINAGMVWGVETTPQTVRLPINRALNLIPIVVEQTTHTPYVLPTIVLPASMVDGNTYYMPVMLGGLPMQITAQTVAGDPDALNPTNAVTLSAQDVPSGAHMRILIYAGGGYT